jgi:hypothetical protein
MSYSALAIGLAKLKACSAVIFASDMETDGGIICGAGVAAEAGVENEGI